MAAADIGVEAIVLPNPQYNPATEYAQVVNASLGFMYQDTDHIRTLSGNNPQNTDLIKGLLYVPTPSRSDSCDNATLNNLIPHNVTRMSSFPASQYPLVALAPWTSVNCVQAFLETMREDQVNGAIFYHPDSSEAQPPQANDPSWSLHDDNKYTSNPFPIYALPGAVGAYLMTALDEYSGDMIDAPHGAALVKQYDSRNFVRLYVQMDVNQSSTIPSLWVFLIIVLAILLAVVLITSIIMHFVQARQRRALQRRVANGEVDLEALGIKRLNVPQSLLDKMPQYIFTTKADPTIPTAAVIAPSSSKTAPAAKATREVPFSQPTCPICLDDFVHGETNVRELPCSHIFHPECIDGFLRDNSSLCPMCKKSALPPGYCPVRVTNLMVRRERLVRRMRERVIIQTEAANGGMTAGRRVSVAVTGFGQRIRRASTSIPVQRSQALGNLGTEMSTVQAAPVAVVNGGAPEAAVPPEIERQGTSARRAWRRERLARVQESTYEGLRRRLNDSDDRPKWRRIVGRVLPGLG